MLPQERFHTEKPPAPFLIKDYLHQTYVRPPLLLVGPGNARLGRSVRDSLIDLVCERNDVDTHLRGMLTEDMYGEPVGRYPDGEAKIKIAPQCSGREVFIFQTPFPEQDKRLMEVFLMIDAARRAGAASITAVLPYYSYGRQDRKNEPRVPISASAIAHILQSLGVDRLITEDIHADQILGTLEDPWDNLYASVLFIPEVRKLVVPEKTVVISADPGGINRAKAYKKRIPGKGIGFVIKNRELNEDSSNPEAMLFVGDVNGRHVVIPDDESVSMASMSNAIWEAANNGAERIVGVLSHLKYSEQSTEHEKMLERLSALPPQFTRLLVTDSIDLPHEVTDLPHVQVVDSSGFWAESIWRTTFGVQFNPDLID